MPDYLPAEPCAAHLGGRRIRRIQSIVWIKRWTTAHQRRLLVQAKTDYAVFNLLPKQPELPARRRSTCYEMLRFTLPAEVWRA